MKNTISIHVQREFTLEDAERVLPVIYRLTEKAKNKVKELVNKKESLKNSSNESAINTAKVFDSEIEKEILYWEQKIKNFGAEPKGLWLVDFNYGKGFFCWRFPETEIKFWHKLDEGYLGRKPIENENSSSTNKYDLREFSKEL